MYYLLGYRILAQPDNLMRCDEQNGTNDSDASRVKLTETQLRHRRQASHFTRSVIFNYTSEEVHTQVCIVTFLSSVATSLQNLRMEFIRHA